MVYEEDFFAWWESEVQRGGRGDLEETVGFEEEREGGHERRAVPSGDVHCVCGPANEAIAAPCERSEPIALRLGDPVVCLHADGQADMRRPAGEKEKKKNNASKQFTEPNVNERERAVAYPHLSRNNHAVNKD